MVLSVKLSPCLCSHNHNTDSATDLALFPGSPCQGGSRNEATTNSHLQIRGIKHLRQTSVCIIVEFNILLCIQDRYISTPKLGKCRTWLGMSECRASSNKMVNTMSALPNHEKVQNRLPVLSCMVLILKAV